MSGESKETRWVAKQLELLREQRDNGPPWLREHHGWHEEQLEALTAALGDGSVAAVPGEVREGVVFYLSQFADGTPEDAFYSDPELYAEVSKPKVEAKDLQPYVRAASLPEAVAAAEGLRAWADATRPGINKLQALLVEHAASAEVQQAGLTRLGALLAEARGIGDTPPPPAPAGLAPAALVPLLAKAIGRFPRDAGVQRAGCSAMRGVVVAEGGCTVVADAGGPGLVVGAMKAHIMDLEVCKAGAAVLYAMIQKTEPSSIERHSIRSTDAHQVLAQALQTHPTDRALDRAVRVTMPELK